MPCNLIQKYWFCSKMVLIEIVEILLILMIRCWKNVFISIKVYRFNFSVSFSTYFVTVQIIVASNMQWLISSVQFSRISFKLKFVRTWFFLDLISSVPLDYIFLIFNSLRGERLVGFKLVMAISGSKSGFSEGPDLE